MTPRVLMKDEIKTRRVFCEFRYGIPAQYESIRNVLRWLLNPRFVYGQTWRCWSGRTTEETMRGTPWGDKT